MKRSYHLLLGLILFSVLAFVVDAITVSMIILPILMSVAPDTDMLISPKLHRNWIFHSIFFPMVVIFFNYNIYHLLFLLSWGVHLLTDISITPSKWIGTYQVKWYHACIWQWEGKGVFSTMWLIINGIAAISISIILFLLLIM
jgi:hypothetical protein